jgi:glucan 1,4-alpha-glucosidase
MRRTTLLWALILLSNLTLEAQKSRQALASPDKKVRVTLDLTPAGAPVWSVTFNKEAVIGTSRLGLTAREADFSGTLKLDGVQRRKNDTTWQPIWGEEATIRDQYRELAYTVRNAKGQLMTIRVRAFNNGVGLRYEFPQSDGSVLTFTDDKTEFRMTGDHTCWWNPLDYDSNEHTYKETALSKIDVQWYREHVEPFNQYLPVQHGVNTPVTMRTAKGTHMSIAEADLTDFGALQLEINPKTLVFKAHVIPTKDTSVLSVNQLPFNTPWRCVLLSPNAGGLLTNRMILNLNDPCALTGDLSWIKPQKYVGVWWEMHVGKSTWDYAGSQDASSATSKLKPTGKHGATTENVKTYIDFAAKNGFSGVLVEGWNVGWERWFNLMIDEVFDFTKPYPDYDMAELSRYAASKGVKIIMHHETSGAVPSYERQMDAGYTYMKIHNMNSVKTGYVGHIIPRGEYHDGQWMVNHFLRVAKRTADHKIMVNMHESVRPSGQHRTYPNWLACEAGRGMEYNAWSSGNGPDHEITLSFTRLLGGPMDYTPGIFHIPANQFDPKKTEQVQTTVAKQLALYVTLYSPFQMAADLPMNYEKRPDVLQFIRDVPVDWQQTRILNAAVGDYITTARQQKGQPHWFIGSITDETPRDFQIPLDFLEKGRTYKATIYEDGPNAHWKTNPHPVNIRTLTVRQGDMLSLKLASSGGAAVSIMAE